MAAITPITLAGGIKAQRSEPARTRPACTASPAFTAFNALSNALAEARAAEELRASPAVWDLALGDLDVAAEDAMNDAIEAARIAGDAPIVLASDRRLVFAARFFYCALGMEHAPDRDNVLHFIYSNSRLWGADGGGPTARRAEALMKLAVERLLALMDLQDEHPSEETLGF